MKTLITTTFAHGFSVRTPTREFRVSSSMSQGDSVFALVDEGGTAVLYKDGEIDEVVGPTSTVEFARRGGPHDPVWVSAIDVE